jgi:hypothetical protein
MYAAEMCTQKAHTLQTNGKWVTQNRPAAAGPAAQCHAYSISIAVHTTSASCYLLTAALSISVVRCARVCQCELQTQAQQQLTLLIHDYSHIAPAAATKHANSINISCRSTRGGIQIPEPRDNALLRHTIAKASARDNCNACRILLGRRSPSLCSVQFCYGARPKAEPWCTNNAWQHEQSTAASKPYRTELITAQCTSPKAADSSA